MTAHWEPLAGRRTHPPRASAVPRTAGRSGSLGGRNLVLGTVAVLTVIRFFTEVIHVLPGLTKVADIPLFFVLLFAAARVPSAVGVGHERTLGRFFVPGLAFLLICIVSVVSNLQRVAPGPVVLFLYGFLGPLVFYYCAERLWPVGHAGAFSRLIVWLGLAQFFAVGVFDLPKFFSTGNPDYVSGTFGENAYQLVFFLLVFSALVAAIGVLEPKRVAARFAIPMIGGALLISFLAQYRALLITTGLAILVTGTLLAASRARGRSRAVVTGAVMFAVFIASLGFVAVKFPQTKFLPYVDAVHKSPTYFLATRIHALDSVVQLYDDHPESVLLGTGPGTFSSRAWITFANPYSVRAQTDPVSQFVGSLSGGTHYHTDVSDQYVLPRYLYSTTLLGSRAINSPLSDYGSLLAEVGLPGFVVLIGIYLAGVVMSARMALVSIRQRVPNDPLPGLFIAATIALFVLLQMAFLGSWLEVTRITAPSWMLLAVARKELLARGAGDAA